ncbi:hypothetical protein [Pseudomonas sp. S3_H09]
MDKNKSSQLRLLAHYLAATKNEVAIDKSVYSLCSCEPSDLGYAPRPAKLISIAGSNLRSIRLIINLAAFMWRVGLDKCWFLLDFLRLMIVKDRFDDRYSNLPSNLPIGLSFSPRALGVLESAGVLNGMGALIKCPGSEALDLDSRVLAFNFSALLTWQDCIQALRLSFIISSRMRKKALFDVWRLQSYTAFKWIAFYLAIEKMSSHKFVITDHYDRWAVLMDRLVAERSKKESSLTIVQHGSLVGLASTSMESSFSVEIPTRLCNVAKLYVYNEGSAEVFRHYILSHRATEHSLEVEFFKPKISLSPVSSDFSVLIVGHAICENFHLYLYDQVVSNYTVDFFYKPHPTVSPSKEIKSRGWHMIEQADFFPEVDLLISYPSTLVAEYEGRGIGAVLHPLAIKPEEYCEVLSRINNKLQAVK